MVPNLAAHSGATLCFACLDVTPTSLARHQFPTLCPEIVAYGKAVSRLRLEGASDGAVAQLQDWHASILRLMHAACKAKENEPPSFDPDSLDQVADASNVSVCPDAASRAVGEGAAFRRT